MDTTMLTRKEIADMAAECRKLAGQFERVCCSNEIKQVIYKLREQAMQLEARAKGK